MSISFIRPDLKKFATTDRQVEFIDAVIEHGTLKAAGKALDVGPTYIGKALKRIQKNAALHGYSPEHDMIHTVPEGYMVKGTSTLYGEDGDKKLQWVKTNTSAAEQLELMREVVDAMNGDIIPSLPVPKTLEKGDDLKLNCFIVTDYHLGMNAWPEEVGGDGWDLNIAENLLFNWFAAAIDGAPKARTAVLAQLGDFLHWDDALSPITPAHGNVLDGDSRTQKVVRIAIRVLRRVVKMLLQSHEHVHIIMAEGNHDPASSIWLREMFHAMYDNEPRITVDISPQPYYCYEHGKTSIFFHHGHKRKPANIDSVFVAKFRDVFGRTNHSYAHMGHLHTKHVVESNLMQVTQHRTLASPDSYAVRGGWVSGRSASVITYHKEYGFVGENCITPEMVA